MPVWWVMEPNITLWLNDEPLGYQPSRGARVSLQMNYQHDWLWAIPNSWYLENVPLHPNIFTFGTNWYSSWRSMLLAPTDSEPVIVYFGGGGQVTFYDREDDGTADGYINYNPDTRARILRQTNGSGVTVSFELQYANGAKDVYGEFRPAFEWPLFFLTAKVDPTGATTSFQYDPSTPSDIIRLKYVLDVDGRTNTIAYTNTVYTNHVTSVTDPYNRTVHFRYNENGILTNMIDVADIPSSFAYDMTGWLTNLVTPYGTTSFKITEDDHAPGEGDLRAGNYVNRAIEITEPNGGKHLYLYREESSKLSPGSGVTLLPGAYNDVPNTANANFSFANTFDNTQMTNRNSFYWGHCSMPACRPITAVRAC